MNGKTCVRQVMTILTALLLMGAALKGPEALAGAAQENSKLVLRKGDRVAVVGDSITEQLLYSRFIELYLMACVPELDLRVTQMGWGGERAPFFLARMNNDLLPHHPTVVTLCYGMNDGEYQPYTEEIGKKYAEALKGIVGPLKAAGVRVVVGSPGIVDPRYFPPAFLVGKIDGQSYNENLARLRDIARQVAAEEQSPFANVYDPMLQVMTRVKADQGKDAIFAGNDGIHPWDNGHLVMAFAFMKALGLEGQIGTITVDMKAGAQATEGHTVLSAAEGTVELESRRYPFCFSKTNTCDGKTSFSARSVLPYVPFNQELNRLILVVANLGANQGVVEWGGASKTFARAQLEKGINLAAEFPDNPFSDPFHKLEEVVVRKGIYENFMTKNLITNFRQAPDWLVADKGVKEALDKTRDALLAEDDRLYEEARKTVTPVRHTIRITAK